MISSHILDTHLGKPAARVGVKLYAENGVLLAESETNADGRICNFNLNPVNIGNYHLEFQTAAYFQLLGLETFFPKVVIHFAVTDPQQHYHIPLLISAFAYSTYRGS